jgi:hypothetical protein
LSEWHQWPSIEVNTGSRMLSQDTSFLRCAAVKMVKRTCHWRTDALYKSATASKAWSRQGRTRKVHSSIYLVRHRTHSAEIWDLWAFIPTTACCHSVPATIPPKFETSQHCGRCVPHQQPALAKRRHTTAYDIERYRREKGQISGRLQDANATWSRPLLLGAIVQGLFACCQWRMKVVSRLRCPVSRESDPTILRTFDENAYLRPRLIEAKAPTRCPQQQI